MRRTTRPSFTQKDVFDDCIKLMRSSNRRTRISANREKVILAASDYATAGLTGSIHSIGATTYDPLDGHATGSDMEWLYENRLVRSVAGKAYYDKLKLANREGRCALCNVSPATTLDHHLPQAKHPVFTVTPDNLLPACLPCNKTKLASLSPTLNTYFDNLGGGRWLKAVIVPLTPLVVDFEIVVQPTWTSELAARAKSHFDLFGLRKTYSFEANRHLAGIKGKLVDTLVRQGPTGVSNYLTEMADSWWAGEPNSLEAAFYSGAAASSWFYSGGFR